MIRSMVFGARGQTKTLWAAALVLLLSVHSAFAVDLSRTPSLDALINSYKLHIQTGELANGMQVVLIEDTRAPVVTHMVWYKAGAAEETPGTSGVAHFFEHLMFKGTEKIAPGEFSKIVARNGGQDNAFTSWDYTAYFQRVAKDRLPLMMEMEADRMQNLTLTDEVVGPERDVILEERSQRTDNNVSALMAEEMNAALYRNHPYGRPIIGWRHEVEALTTQNALDFYRKFYAPDNAILVVAGDISLADLMVLAEKYYGDLVPSGLHRTERLAEPPQRAPRRITMRDPQVQQPRLRRSYMVPSFRTAPSAADAAALDVLSDILGEGMTSRLYKNLVIENPVASSAWAYYQGSMRDDTSFMVGATALPGVALETVEAAIDTTLTDIAENGVSDDEVLRAQLRLMAGAVQTMDSAEGQARMVGGVLAAGYELKSITDWPQQLRRVNAEDVQRAAQSYLDMNASVTGLLLPPAPAGEEGED